MMRERNVRTHPEPLDITEFWHVLYFDKGVGKPNRRGWPRQDRPYTQKFIYARIRSGVSSLRSRRRKNKLDFQPELLQVRNVPDKRLAYTKFDDRRRAVTRTYRIDGLLANLHPKERLLMIYGHTAVGNRRIRIAPVARHSNNPFLLTE